MGLIDLDTCNRHTVLVDLGDAVRSWCRDGSEDEQQHFRIDRFEAILAGYSEDGLSLSRHEIDYLGQAGRTITMELASRFAKDVMVDEYFAYDRCATKVDELNRSNPRNDFSRTYIAPGGGCSSLGFALFSRT